MQNFLITLTVLSARKNLPWKSTIYENVFYCKWMFVLFRWAAHVHRMKTDDLQYRSWHSVRHQANCWWEQPAVMLHCLRLSRRVDSDTLRRRWWILQHAVTESCGLGLRQSRWRVMWSGRVPVISQCALLWPIHRLLVRVLQSATASCKYQLLSAGWTLLAMCWVWVFTDIFICPIAMAQQGTDYKITCVCLSFCQSVCKHSYGRNFDSILINFAQ